MPLDNRSRAQTPGFEPDLPATKEGKMICKPSVPETTAVNDRTGLDLACLKGQLPRARVLDQLGLSSRLRGSVKSLFLVSPMRLREGHADAVRWPTIC
jgi:hypothetical protein